MNDQLCRKKTDSMSTFAPLCDYCCKITFTIDGLQQQFSVTRSDLKFGMIRKAIVHSVVFSSAPLALPMNPGTTNTKTP
jgi:hypothetical protein